MSENYGEIFELELECWCVGLERVQDKIDLNVLHKVIKEFAPVLREAVENFYVCDILETARRLVSSAKLHRSEKEIAFYILSQLPSPLELTREQAAILAQTVEQVEQRYGGAVKRLEKKWQTSLVKSESSRSKSDLSLNSLSFPKSVRT